MMPKTRNGLSVFDTLSCLQKAIRRGEERLAMQCAVELLSSRKAFETMCLNRLVIIVHEDLDTMSNPMIICAVEATLRQIEDLRKKPGKESKIRMLTGTIIRLMCRAPKSREGDHFHVAVGRSVINGTAPVLPEWVYDKHTMKGRRLGRGLDHFRESSCLLVNGPENKDPYEDEAFAIWAAEAKAKAEGNFSGSVDENDETDEPDDLLELI